MGIKWILWLTHCNSKTLNDIGILKKYKNNFVSIDFSSLSTHRFWIQIKLLN